jgi:hypothetical protein
MAARTLLLKLERAGHIALPARRGASVNARRNLHIDVGGHLKCTTRGHFKMHHFSTV